MKFICMIVAIVTLCPSSSIAQAVEARLAADTTAMGFSWVGGFFAGGGETSFHAGMMGGPVSLDFNGDYKKWGPPESDMHDPLPWFRHVGERTYMRKGLGIGVGVHSYDLIYLYAGADLTWTMTYDRWASNATGDVWFTEKNNHFKVGWWGTIYLHPWEAGVLLGIGYGDLRGPYASLAVGFI